MMRAFRTLPIVHTTDAYDIIIVGLGANGSSALYQLSRSGKKVLGIDRFQPPHDKGSSHGESRIIRQAYHENPLYVPLVKAAYPLWEELAAIAGKPLFVKTGGLLLGDQHSMVVQGARVSAETHGIPYEWLDATAIQERFPAFRPTPGTVGVLEKEAGVLFPELCVAAFLQAAADNGAEMHSNERVIRIVPDIRGGIEVTTVKQESIGVGTATTTYRTGKLIVSAGAWLGELMPELRLPLTVNRQVLFWFDNADAATRPYFQPAKMPIFIWEYQRGNMFYGFPDLGGGTKLAWHHGGRAITPDAMRNDTTEDEIAGISRLAAAQLTIEPVFKKSAVCMYTNTPDEDFIIDHHPDHPNIIIASPCSGHGFKFSSLTGKLLADLALTGHTGFDLSPFAIGRRALAHT
jgi:sarcosine oxidase